MLYTILAMAQAPQAASGQPQANPLVQLLPFVLIFAVMWFFMLRPQSKKQKEMQLMLDNVQVNDWVLTNGGIIGKITSIKPDKNVVVIEIDDNNHIRVEFQKSAIVTVLNKDDKTANNQA
jgi:preprotein translocase subunit YajC